MAQSKTHLISYPRSGNHAVRTILEFCSGRPTSGCPESEDIDPPIHTRPANSDGLIQIHSPDIVAYKSHSISEVLYWDRNIREGMKVILITRDPLKCIFSHVYRSLRKKLFVNARQVDEAVDKEISSYMALVYMFCTIQHRPKLHAKFESILSENHTESLESIRKMLRFVDPNIKQPSSSDLESLFKVSRKSQKSLKYRRKIKLEERILESIKSRINYAEVLNLIEECSDAE